MTRLILILSGVALAIGALQARYPDSCPWPCLIAGVGGLVLAGVANRRQA
jgi:uncharacterized membrane protein HdeD (DUF308 family)